MRGTHVAGVVVVVVGLAFGVLGGEYSMIDRWKLNQQVDAEREQVRRLQREIDSLTAVADALESDSATIERAARENLGMLREGEMLYRVEGPVDSDSVGIVQ
ncbi:MAG: septum formation initiator family protein [Gemmatimonadetes bacterium]|nr:septum formation initiator family protein [Gemmatimonadota bacterium]